MKIRGIFKFSFLIIVILLSIFSIYQISQPSFEISEVPEEIKESYGNIIIDNPIPIAIKLIAFSVIALIIILLLIKKIKRKNGKQKKNKKLNLDDGVIALLSFLAWYIFNDAVNIHSMSDLGIYEVGIIFKDFAVPIVEFIWLGLFVSFILAMILVFRSYWKVKTPKLDILFNIIIVLSFIFMFIATILQLSNVSVFNPLWWMFGLTRGSIYHIGVVGYVVSLLYYSLTE